MAACGGAQREGKEDARSHVVPPARHHHPVRRGDFGEEPLPLEKLKAGDVKAHLVSAELELAAGVPQDVEATLIVDGGQLLAEWRARGPSMAPSTDR